MKKIQIQGTKQCANNHYYQEGLSSCPFCDANKNKQTEETRVYPSGSIGKNDTVIEPSPKGDKKKLPKNNETRYEDKDEEIGSSDMAATPPAARRKLVGWLVTYQHNAAGNDYRIFEGNNTIGRDLKCNIVIPDDLGISFQHAVINYRAKRYVISDDSSYGTLVNGEDTGYRGTAELHDGDIITVGRTMLLFRSSFPADE